MRDQSIRFLRFLLGLMLVTVLIACGRGEEQAATPTAPILPTPGDPLESGSAPVPTPVLGQGADPTAGAVVAAQPLNPPQFLSLVIESDSGIQAGSTVSHIVSEGEWLVQIVRCYGASYTAVLTANPTLTNPASIQAGSTLIIPNVGSNGPIAGPPCVVPYVVQAGDTWQSIAAQFGLTDLVLQQANSGSLIAGTPINVPAARTDQTGLPRLSQAMLLNIDGTLGIWRPGSDQIEQIVFSDRLLAEMASDAQGRRLLVTLFDTAVQRTDVVLIDLETRTILPVANGVTQPSISSQSQLLAVSADGQDGAFAAVVENGLEITHFRTDSLAVVSRVIVPLPAGPAQIPQQLFAGREAFYWFGHSTVVRMPLDGSGSEPIWAGDPTMPEISGLIPLAQSPERELLLVSQRAGEIAETAVFDPNTGSLTVLPGAGRTAANGGAVSWQPDGTLVILSPPQGSGGVEMAQFGVAINNDGRLALTQIGRVRLTAGETAVDTISDRFYIAAPTTQAVVGEAILQIETADETASGGWLAIQPDAALLRLSTYALGGESGQGALSWSGDNLAVLVLTPGGADQTAVLLLVENGRLLSLSDLLGQPVYDARWVDGVR